MKNSKLPEWGNRLYSTLYVFLTFLPLYLLAGLILLPGEQVYAYICLVALCMLLGMLFGHWMRKELFYAYLLDGLLAVGAVTYFMLTAGDTDLLSNMTRVLAGALCMLPAIQSSRNAARPWYEAQRTSASVALLFLYAVILLFVKATDSFGDYQYLMPLSVFLDALFLLPASNRANISEQFNRNTRYRNKKIREEQMAEGTGNKPLPISPGLRRRNRILVALALLLAAAVTMPLGWGLSRAGEGLVTMLNNRPEEIVQETTKNPDQEVKELTEKVTDVDSSFRDIANIVSLAAFALLFSALIFLIFRKGRNFLVKLFSGPAHKHNKRKKGEQDEKEEELYDEISEGIEFSLFGGKKLSELLKEKIGWPAMRTEEEKVRYLLRHTVRNARGRGYRFSRAKTAFETLGEIAGADGNPRHERALRDLADAYNTTRYDANPPQQGTAASIREALGKK